MSTVIEKKLVEERASSWKQMEDILNTAHSEERDLSAEEAQRYDKLEQDLDAKSAELDRLQRHAERKQALEKPQEVDYRLLPGGDRVEEERDAAPVTERPEYREAFFDRLKFGYNGLEDEQKEILERGRMSSAEFRALAVGTDSAGGYTVPTEFLAEMIEAQKAFGGVRQVARVVPTSDGRDLDMPTIDDTDQEGELVGENTPASEQDTVYGSKTLKAYKYSSKMIKVPMELLQDSAFDLDSHLSDVLATRIGRITNRHFTVGDDDDKPEGIVESAALGKAAAAVGEVTYEELLDLLHSVDPAYRVMGSRWMFHDNTLRDLRKITDGENRLIFQPGMVPGEPNTLLGYSYVINQHMATMEASADAVLFGWMGSYAIRDVMSTTIIRLNERYAEAGQVAFLAWARHDGRGLHAETNNEAVKKLTMDAGT